MQITLDKSDRRLLKWTLAVIIVLMIVLAALSVGEEKDSGIPTSYSSESSGAKAAYLLLKEEGYKVERWESSLDELPDDPAHTLLVLAGPIRPAVKEEKQNLQMFLSRGGKILATGYYASFFVPDGDVVPEALASAVGKEFPPEIPSALTRGGPIKFSPGSHWGDPKPNQLVHYAHEGKGIVVSYKVGKGEVIWWASSGCLSNAGIRDAGNLDLLLNSMGGSKDVRVLWDEYFHSYHGRDTSYTSLPPVKYGLWQCALAFLALLFAYARRNAPIHPFQETSRLSPLEFVNTLGSLYRRANATRTALEVPYYRFKSLLARKLGLRANTPSADLARGARKRLGYKAPGLEDTLEQIEKSLDDLDLKERQVLDLVQKLSQHAHNLKLISQE